MKNNKGFSLVELIIVIAIMAILAGAIAPALLKYMEKAKEAADIKNMDSAVTVMNADYADSSLVEGTVYYFDVDGSYMSETKPAMGYGKGTGRNGGTVYPQYDPTEDVRGLFICIEIRGEGDYDMYWSN